MDMRIQIATRRARPSPPPLAAHAGAAALVLLQDLEHCTNRCVDLAQTQSIDPPGSKQTLQELNSSEEFRGIMALSKLATSKGAMHGATRGSANSTKRTSVQGP